MIQREELPAPTVSCSVEQCTSQDCSSGGLRQSFCCYCKRKIACDTPPVLLLYPQIENGSCVSSKAAQWLMITQPCLACLSVLCLPAWGKLTVKPELLYSPLSLSSSPCQPCALWPNLLLMHCTPLHLLQHSHGQKSSTGNAVSKSDH